MSFTIEQVVGNWITAGGEGVAITPKAPGNTIFIIAAPGGPSGGAPTFSDTAGNTITALGSVDVSNEYQSQAVISSCLAAATTIEISGAQASGCAVIAVEVSGLEDAAALASDVAVPTYASNVASLPATGTINAVPALAISWGAEAQTDGIFSSGAYNGWTLAAPTWQTAPPQANRIIVQYQEITSAQAVTAQVNVSATYDSVGMGVAVFQEAPPPVPLAGAPTDAASATGALTTAVLLAGAAASATTAAGILSGFYAAAVSASSASGALTVVQAIQAAATAATSASAALTNWSTVTLAAPLYSGPGSILDPNGSWSNGAPGAGAAVYYDGTNMSVQANGEMVATLAGFSAIAQWLPSAGVSSVLPINVAPGFAAYASDAASAHGAVSTAILLMASAQALANATGSLIAQVQMQGAAQAVTRAAAALATAIQLQVAMSDNSVASGALQGSQGAALAGAMSDASSASGNINTMVQMLGAAAALVQATAALTAQVRFSGNVQVAATAQGSLSTADFANVVAQVQSQASGALTTAVRLAAPAVSVVAAAAQLATQVQLAASAAVAASASATLVENPLAGSASDSSQASGALTTQELIDAAVQTISAATGQLTTFINMSASAASVAAGAGALSTYQPLLGSAADDSNAAASLTAPGSPTGLYTENPWWVVAGIRQDSTSRFPIISPAETEVLTFDFSDELLQGEELQGRITVSVSCTAGENANPQAVLLGAPSYDPTQHMVELPVGSCPDGEDFYFTVTAPTTTPYKVLTRYGLLQSRA